MQQLLVSELQEGDFIGDYQVIQALGRGPHTTTYHVVSSTNGKDLACRVYALGEEFSPEIVERLHAEMTLCGKLAHPHIESVLSSLKVADQWVVIKDFVSGPSDTACNIADFAKEYGGVLSPYQVFHVAEQLLQALDYAHNWQDANHHTVIHGAIKPENILVGLSCSHLSNGAPFSVQLSDFQPYHLWNEASIRSENIRWQKSMCHAAGLIQQEMLNFSLQSLRQDFDYQAIKGYSIQGDLWSVGSVLWKLLFGVPIGAHLGKFPKTPFSLPLQWEEFFVSIIHADPVLRPFSAKEALHLLEPLRETYCTAKEKKDTPAVSSERMGLTPPAMVFLPQATFLVGSESAGSDALPQHEEQTRGFYIDRAPVTVGQFRQFVEETGYKTDAEKNRGAPLLLEGEWRIMEGVCWKNPTAKPPPDDFSLHPVTQVTYNDAMAYCEWLGRRLPTEQEWEYAAKGGQSITRYPWGDAESTAHAHVGGEATKAVMQYQANGYGLYDMAGNVWEWTGSYYQPYPGNQMHNPHFGTEYRVVRGGCWLHHLSHCIVAFRNANQPDRCYPTIGFRTVADF